MIRRRLTTAALLAATLLTASRHAAPAEESTDPWHERAELYAIARDAYLYAYPIVTMDVTMRQATNVPDAVAVNMHAPFNQFAHVRSYPKAENKEVVRFNFDTLYSSAWLDLSKEPIILSVPDTQGRYYLLPMLDMWTDVFAVVGSRTTGTKAGHFAITASGWTGELPEGVTKIVAPTPIVWIIGRTQTNGPSDYAAVHKVQDGYKLTPLSHWGRDYTPPKDLPTDPNLDNKTPPQTIANNLDGAAMLTRLADLLKKHPPHANDYPILFRLKKIGIEPGKPFDAAKLTPEQTTVVEAAKQAMKEMQLQMRSSGEFLHGWNINVENMGTYGTSYGRRAYVAMAGLGCNLPEDAVYPLAFVDGEGKPLSGANKYVLRFEKGKLPPANAFWSITMYDENGFQVPNPINRFAIGSHDKLTFNADGSLEIYVQTESPGDGKESNWLPAPQGHFQPTMRIYSPRQEVLTLNWSPPPFEKVK